MSRNKAVFLLVFFLLLFYRFFISAKIFVAHDWPLLFRESRNFIPFWNISWDYMGNGGIGGPAFKTLWIDLYTNLVYAISNFANIPWWLSQRIFWILPFLLISLFSSYTFSGIFIKRNILRGLSAIIYTFNTYILLIIGGGQFGIAFAYGLLPLVLYLQIKFFDKFNRKSLIYSAVSSGLLLALDPRVAILEFITAFFWYVIFVNKYTFSKVKLIVVNLIIVTLLNSYWILPILKTSVSFSSISQYSSELGVKFLSFANFSNSISLLAPNWPENIFGKVYFFRPEFILIPIFVFGFLLFKNKKEILFLGILALAAAFLGKGTNEPFGAVYSLLFKLPGFSLFRDSTKFFIIVALSYSILIPYFLEKLPKFKNLILSAFIIYWFIILKPAWSGELNGIFELKQIPQEYIQLNEQLKNDRSFYRTLWFPQKEKYGYFDLNHPAIDAESFLHQTNYSQILKDLRMIQVQKLIQESGVKYVIVPYDVDGEIFLKDRRYDDSQYKKAIENLDKIFWLTKDKNFRKIVVYRVASYKQHFWSSAGNSITYQTLNPAEYKVKLSNAKKGDILVFSEGYDPNWIAETSGYKLQSLEFDHSFNSFVMPKSGDFELKIYYQPQMWVNLGLIISVLTLIGLIFWRFMISYSK